MPPCFLLSDGAACIVFSTAEWAEKNAKSWGSKPTVELTGTGCGTDFMRMADRPFPDPGIIHFRGKQSGAQQAYEMAGVKNPREDFDCFEVHDAFRETFELIHEQYRGRCALDA